MSIRQIGVFNTRSGLQNYTVPSFSEKQINSKKSENDKKINKVVFLSASIGISITAAWLYLKSQGPKLLKKLFNKA